MGAEAPKTAEADKGEVVVFDVATTGAIHVKQPSIPDCDLVRLATKRLRFLAAVAMVSF